MTAAPMYTHKVLSSIGFISWKKSGLVLSCLESVKFLSEQQSFTTSEDLADVACFLNQGILWRESKLIRALCFTKDFVSNPTFNPMIPAGIQCNEHPESYNIIMLLLLAQKHSIDVDESDSSDDIYFRIKAFLTPLNNLQNCLADWRNLQRIPEFALRELYETYRFEEYEIPVKERVYIPETYRRFYPELPVSAYVDIQHLAYIEGCELPEGTKANEYYNWLLENPPSFYFIDQRTGDIPEFTALNKTKDCLKEHLIFSVDNKQCTTIGEIMLNLRFIHPFQGNKSRKQDILKLRRRFRDAQVFKLYRDDYESVNFKVWLRLLNLGLELRKDDSNMDFVTDQLYSFDEVSEFALVQKAEVGVVYLNFSIGERISMLISHPELPEGCSMLNSNYFIDTACYACRLLGSPQIEYENLPFLLV